MRQTLRQVPVLLTLGAFAVAPFLNPIAVQSAPQIPDLSKILDKARGESLTLNGVVTRDITGDQFYFKADDGRAFRVVAAKGEPNRLIKGDRVEVRGWRDAKERDLITANSVVRIAEQGETVKLNGVVTRDLVGDQFNFRDDEGRTFRVVAPKGEPIRLAVGDRVEVRGQRDAGDRDVIVANSVNRIVDAGAGEKLTLSGVVTRDLAGNEFNFRADDGRKFRIALRGTQPKWLSDGDRIEVAGRRDSTEHDVIIADSVRALGANGNAGSVSQYGIVTRNLNGNTFEIRTGDGTHLILVTARNGEPRDLSVGDNVRVEGIVSTVRNEITMAAEVVEIVKDSNGPGLGGNGSIGKNADLSGVAMRVEGRNRLDVQVDNGRVYSVNAADKFSSNIKNGERVRVTGKWSSATTIRADKVVLEAQTNPGAANGEVNFWGQVQSVSNNGLIRDFKVRGDNGWLYNVQYRNLQTFRVGDRVHVIGTIANGGVTASSVSTR